MSIQAYQQNRERFLLEELQPFDGKWVAFSADGSRIVAAADEIGTLHMRLTEAGVRPEEVKLERILLEDDWEGGGVELE
jgi:hypothetical protein